MKKHTFYRWFRRVAMLSGIPALTMLFACGEHECLYGPPSDVIWGSVLEKGTERPIPEVVIKDENSLPLDTTDEYGQFELTARDCEDFTFSKEGYQSKDTMLCPAVHSRMIYLEKLPEE